MDQKRSYWNLLTDRPCGRANQWDAHSRVTGTSPQYTRLLLAHSHLGVPLGELRPTEADQLAQGHRTKAGTGLHTAWLLLL